MKICLFLLIISFFKFITPIYEGLTNKEKLHLFGKNSLKVRPKFEEISINNFNGRSLNITIEGKKILFQIKDASLNLYDIGLHHFLYTNNRSKNLLEEHVYYDKCSKVYKGESTTPKGNIISLTGCKNNLRGLIITNENKMYFIHPIPKKINYGNHVIHKRSISEVLSPENHDCIFNKNYDPFPEDQIESDTLISKLKKIKKLNFIKHINKRDIVNEENEIIIEIAIFADYLMIKHFYDIYGKDDHIKELKRFVIATVNNVDSLYKHQTLNSNIHFRIKRIDIMEKEPLELESTKHDNGEVNKLLKTFCEYQQKMKPTNRNDPKYWDHALLFTGYDIYGGELKNIAGFAPVKGMCSEVRSCTINEGIDFGSVFVVTHEIGHNLGMYHDGQNECHTDCCIMAPSIGSGKTKWSLCSSTEMKIFVQKLGTESNRPPNCLKFSAKKSKNIGVLPGQDYTVNEQCKLFHGKCWNHGLRSNQKLEEICQMIWCTDGGEKFRTSHPALEGTYCGKGKVCFSGKCVESKKNLTIIDGGWSEWKSKSYCNLPDDDQCQNCQIDGQIIIKKEYRYCDNPFPNNGGKLCNGDNIRGKICNEKLCSKSETIQQYIDNICKIKSKLEKNIEINMIEKGLHFEHDLCKVWCFIKSSTSVRTVDDMPDGTPCGHNSFCLNGECKSLICNGTILGGNINDCTTTQNKYLKSLLKTSEWESWLSWSKCTSTKCGEIGYKKRKRICKDSTCPGIDIQETTCKFDCTKIENNWSNWSNWLECSATECDKEGKQIRTRKCLSNKCIGSEIESQSCQKFCLKNYGKFTEWSSWSKCNFTKDCQTSSFRKRRRDCWSTIIPNPVCNGEKEEIQLCPRSECIK
uniref:Peptidase M12B domain-containing protein n=1 Tax=Strongyloides stercoralis TaxID=6248 RepID=A0A0K0DWH0_STRER